MRLFRAVGAVAWIAGGAAFVACGGALPATSSAPAPSAAPSDAKEPSTSSGDARPTEELTTESAPTKKREVDATYSAEAPATSKAAGPTPIAPPPPTPIAASADAAPRSTPSPAPSRIERAQSDFDRASKSLVEAGAECATLCKALASMQRSADALCNLSKDGEASDKRRCTDAQRKVEAATAKVKATCAC